MIPQKIINNRFGIVTGAASGIGRAAAIHLAQMGAGVALVDLNGYGLEKTESFIQQKTASDVLVFKTDVTDETEVNRIVHQTIVEFGAIDFLVNSAGILKRAAFLDISTPEWDLVLNVNLRGQFLFCKAVSSHMADRGKGVIVNVASLAGRSSSFLGGAHYTAAKHAVIGLSRHMARDLAPLGLRINAFCPGATLTSMIINTSSTEEIQSVASSIPRGKLATPEEQAAVIGFLVSDAAININGACIDSNGGALMV